MPLVGRFPEDRSLGHSEMDLLVAASTQSDEVLVRVVAEQTARPNVMDLESIATPAMLAAPRVSLQYPFVQYAVRTPIEVQPRAFRARKVISPVASCLGTHVSRLSQRVQVARRVRRVARR
jgi:hypothetical protein